MMDMRINGTGGYNSPYDRYSNYDYYNNENAPYNTDTPTDGTENETVNTAIKKLIGNIFPYTQSIETNANIIL